jgi:hypothetical protein
MGGARPSVAEGPALPVHGQPCQEILLLDPATKSIQNIENKIPSESLLVDNQQLK